ncbi:MAG: hypothetical protein VKP57_05305 [Candidatus Sericytochromatia bacterium]|nr:hypothetical protein [Candidatus Sericytochromatia bacterium]
MPVVSRRVLPLLATGLPCVVLWACSTQPQGSATTTGANPVLPLSVGVQAGTPRPLVSASPTTPPPLFKPVTPTPAPTPTPTLVPMGIAIEPAVARNEAYAFNQFFVPAVPGEAEKPDLPYTREWVSVIQFGRPAGDALPSVVETTQPVLGAWTLSATGRRAAIGAATPEPGAFVLLTALQPATASEAAVATASHARIRILPQAEPFLGEVTALLTVAPAVPVAFVPSLPVARRVATVSIEAANVGTPLFQITGLGGR